MALHPEDVGHDGADYETGREIHDARKIFHTMELNESYLLYFTGERGQFGKSSRAVRKTPEEYGTARDDKQVAGVRAFVHGGLGLLSGRL